MPKPKPAPDAAAAAQGAAARSRAARKAAQTRARKKAASSQQAEAGRRGAAVHDATPLEDRGDGRNEGGRFVRHNRLWLYRASAGAEPHFATVAEFAAAVAAYFEWLEGEGATIAVERVAVRKEGVTHYVEERLRLPSLTALCSHMGILLRTWHGWRTTRPDFDPVRLAAEQAITSAKIEGAAADVFNAAFVAREMGLVERRETAHGLAPDLTALLRDINAAGAGRAPVVPVVAADDEDEA